MKTLNKPFWQELRHNDNGDPYAVLNNTRYYMNEFIRDDGLGIGHGIYVGSAFGGVICELSQDCDEVRLHNVIWE